MQNKIGASQHFFILTLFHRRNNSISNCKSSWKMIVFCEQSSRSSSAHSISPSFSKMTTKAINTIAMGYFKTHI